MRAGPVNRTGTPSLVRYLVLQSSDSFLTKSTVNLDTSKWSSEDRARAAEYQASFRPLSPGDYNLGAAPTGPLDVRMGRFPPAPSPRPHTPSDFFLSFSSKRHH